MNAKDSESGFFRQPKHIKCLVMISNLPPDNLIVYVAWLPQFLRSFLNYSWFGIYWSCFRLYMRIFLLFFPTYVRTSQFELSIRIGMLNAKQSDYRH